jgi:hypothetical protein
MYCIKKVDLGLINKIISEKQVKKFALQKIRFADFSIYLIFYSIQFLYFYFQLDYCSLKKRSVFSKQITLLISFLDSRKLFFFLVVADLLRLVHYVEPLGAGPPLSLLTMRPLLIHGPQVALV